MPTDEIAPKSQNVELANAEYEMPLMTIKEYAARTNQTVYQVRQDMESGFLPYYQLEAGKKRQVNMAALRRLTESACENIKPWNKPHTVASI